MLTEPAPSTPPPRCNSVEQPGKTLKASPESHRLIDAARNLIGRFMPARLTAAIIERVVLTPPPTGKGFEIELIGGISAMVALGLTDGGKGMRLG